MLALGVERVDRRDISSLGRPQCPQHLEGASSRSSSHRRPAGPGPGRRRGRARRAGGSCGRRRGPHRAGSCRPPPDRAGPVALGRSPVGEPRPTALSSASPSIRASSGARWSRPAAALRHHRVGADAEFRARHRGVSDPFADRHQRRRSGQDRTGRQREHDGQSVAHSAWITRVGHLSQRLSRPGTSAEAGARWSRSWSRAAEIGDDASAGTVFHPVTGRQELHDLGSRACSLSSPPLFLTSHHEPDAARLRRSPALPVLVPASLLAGLNRWMQHRFVAAILAAH